MSAGVIGPLMPGFADVKEAPKRSQPDSLRRFEAMLENEKAVIYGAGDPTNGALRLGRRGI
jgi:hypothetical protein